VTGREVGALVLAVLFAVVVALAAATWDPCSGRADAPACERSLLP